MNNVTGQALALAMMALTIFVMVYVGTRAYQRARARG